MNRKIIAAREMLCKYLLDLALENSMSYQDISKSTGLPESKVLKILNSQQCPTLDEFISISEALNTYFFVIDKEADDDLVTLMKNRWGKIEDN